MEIIGYVLLVYLFFGIIFTLALSVMYLFTPKEKRLPLFDPEQYPPTVWEYIKTSLLVVGFSVAIWPIALYDLLKDHS